MLIYITFILCALGGYLLGSVPFGLVLTRLAGLGDIRKIGSGNIGATNVLRTGRKDLALLTVLLDASKAGIAAWLAYHFVAPTGVIFINIITNQNIIASLIAGAFGVLGHNFPIWLKFKGGKGVAAAFGFILFTQPLLALYALGIWLIMAFAFKYSSLAALVAAACVPVMSYYLAPLAYTYVYGMVVILIIVRHYTNIKRLLEGKE